MSSLNDLIFDLLVNNDCVVLPDFGAFISQNQKAKINRENWTISPPSKRIGFNPKLTNNDGLLVSAIAKHKKSNYSEATTIVKKYVEYLSKKLNEGNRIEINKVGVFYLDKNKNIFFEQDNFYFFNSKITPLEWSFFAPVMLDKQFISFLNFKTPKNPKIIASL